jgi:hypothetical protein
MLERIIAMHLNHKSLGTWFIFISIMFFSTNNCGSKSKKQSQNVNFRQLDAGGRSTKPFDAEFDSEGEDESDDDQDSSPDDSSQDGSSDGEQGAGTPNPSPTPQDPGKITDSAKIYEKTVYPLARKSCGGGCHDTIIAPVFASDNITMAHDTLLSTHKVDFADIPKSRLILRMIPDQHRCPPQGCEAAAKEFQDAITAWAKEVGDSVQNPAQTTGGIATGNVKFSAPESTRMDSGLPPGVLLYEAEMATLRAPMVALAVTGAGGGSVVHTPAGAGNQNNITTAETQTTLGGVVFDVDVLEAGSYELIGRVNAPANANSSFYIKVDANPLVLWDFPTTGANYVYDKADAAAAAGTPHVFNLMPGKHKIEIRQRQEQAKVDSIILTTDPAVDPMNIKPSPKEVRILGIDISQATGVPGSKFTIEVVDYSPNAYMFKNPKVNIASGSLNVKGLKLLVNGKYLPQNSTYTTVDMKVTAPGAVLSKAALVAVKDKGPEMDQFSFTFEKLEKQP